MTLRGKQNRLEYSGEIIKQKKYKRELELTFLPNTKNLFCYNISCIVTSMMFVRLLLQITKISTLYKQSPFCYTVKNEAIIASMK